MTSLRSTVSPSCPLIINHIITLFSTTSPSPLPGFISGKTLFLHLPKTLEFDRSGLGLLFELGDELECDAIGFLLASDRGESGGSGGSGSEGATRLMMRRLREVGGLELVDPRVYGLNGFVCMGKEL